MTRAKEGEMRKRLKKNLKKGLIMHVKKRTISHLIFST